MQKVDCMYVIALLLTGTSLLWLKAIYEHAGGERGSLFPGGPDVYRSTCYVRDEDNQSFRVTATEMDGAFASSSS